MCLSACTTVNYPNGKPAVTTAGAVKALTVSPATGITAEEITSPLTEAIRTAATGMWTAILSMFRL
jgi:hypothetical protein